MKDAEMRAASPASVHAEYQTLLPDVVLESELLG
jgi:hypothetical protein